SARLRAWAPMQRLDARAAPGRAGQLARGPSLAGDVGGRVPGHLPIMQLTEVGVVKSGRKKDVRTETPVPSEGAPPRGPKRAVWFMEGLLVPKGVGARGRLRVRDWQRRLIEGVLTEPRPRSALWAMPRGNGKSTLAAALGLYGLYMDDEIGASVV